MGDNLKFLNSLSFNLVKFDIVCVEKPNLVFAPDKKVSDLSPSTLSIVIVRIIDVTAKKKLTDTSQETKLHSVVCHFMYQAENQ